MKRSSIAIAAFASALAPAFPISADDFTVHRATTSVKVIRPDGGGGVEELHIHTRRMINLRLREDLDAPVPENYQLVLLVACPWDTPIPETTVAHIAVWDTAAGDVVAGTPWLYAIEGVASEIPDAEVRKAVVVMAPESPPGEVTITGTFTFEELGKKFEGQADRVCASTFKSDTVSGGSASDEVWLKGRLIAKKPFGIYVAP